jgi:RNA polymerase sigma-70 factor, ECF subfamily
MRGQHAENGSARAPAGNHRARREHLVEHRPAWFIAGPEAGGALSVAQGESSPRTWLYRIATNACLDTLRRNARRAAHAPSSSPAGSGPSVAAMPWVQPYPDSLLAEVAADQPGPEAVAVSRETMSLAFLAALQLLPPRQRAVLILRDVISWPAAEVADLLAVSVPAVNSALQRARTTLRDQWPGGRLDWAPAAEPDPEQRRLLQRFIAAHEQADPEALIAVLGRDVRLAISQVGEWNGLPEVGDALRGGMNALGQWRLLPIMANGQPGAAGYLRRPGQTAFVPFVLTVLRLEHGRVIDIAAFEQPSMFAAFGLPASL